MLENINIQGFALMILMIIICIIGLILLIIPLFLNKEKNTTKKNKNLEVSDKKIKKIDIQLDQEEIKKEAFNLYKKSEIAKTKFDYDTLKEILTDSLYKEEEQKLKQLKEEKLKLVATNIKLQDIKIISVTKENINIYLYVSQYDYVTNSKKKVIRGTDETEYQIEYKLTLEKNKDKYFKIKKKECTGKWIKNL